jgi:hypothetical protein
MKWFESKPKIVVRKQRELNERELNAACAMVDENHPLWLAIHQLIDTARDNALENADQNMDPPGILAGYVGGAAHLKLLKDDLHNRRELGLAQSEEKGSMREAWLKKQTESPPPV